MNSLKGIIFSIALFGLSMPMFVFAAYGNGGRSGGASVGCNTSGGFNNPLKCNISSVSGFTEAFIKAALYIVFPIAVLFIIYSGFLFITAQGNPEGLKKAKSNFLWTIVGVTLLLGALALAALIKGTIDPILR